MDKFKELLTQIGREISSRDGTIEHLLNENRLLLNSNESLRAQLDTARRSFGEGFIKGDIFKNLQGPSRPNRHKLSEVEVKDIRAAHRGGMKQKDLARNYGVNPATISRTVRGIYH